MSADDPRCAMLFEMTACAHRLGLRFAAEAERADEIGRRIEYAGLFERCFFAVRVGIALELRLRREGRWEAARDGREDRDSPADRAERDPPEDERPEAFEPERPALYTEGDRDRDREAERATLPLLLDTLQGVAADAAATGPAARGTPDLARSAGAVRLRHGRAARCNPRPDIPCPPRILDGGRARSGWLCGSPDTSPRPTIARRRAFAVPPATGPPSG